MNKDIPHSANGTRPFWTTALWTAVAALSLSAFLAVCGGCTNCTVVDVSDGLSFGYSYSEWESMYAEEVGARARAYAYGAEKHYMTNVFHDVRVELLEGGTNRVKGATYRFYGKRKAQWED